MRGLGAFIISLCDGKKLSYALFNLNIGAKTRHKLHIETVKTTDGVRFKVLIPYPNRSVESFMKNLTRDITLCCH
jgi:hypothetical protein